MAGDRAGCRAFINDGGRRRSVLVEVQVERALSTDLWTQVRAELDARCVAAPCEGEDLGGLTPTEDEARQWRIARAAILLMGNSGVRRDEAANARRENLSVAVVTSGGPAKTSAKGSTRSSPTALASEAASEAAPKQTSVTVWALTVVGKRRKQRTVPVSAAAVAALRAVEVR